jgi:hypothetical protein
MRPWICRRFHFSLLAAVVGAALSTAGAAGAQPFGAILLLSNAGNQYVEIPDSPSLNPPAALTIEFLSASDAAATPCLSLIGKNYVGSGGLWIGNCKNKLRSYINGVKFDGGQIRTEETTHHIAVTYDGVQRKHYIDGELVAVLNQSGAIVPNSSALRFGDDVSWHHTPTGFIDEVRFWNVARTQSQIQQFMSVPIKSAQPGLVSVWSLNGDNGKALDSVGGNNGGTPQGGASFGFLLHPGGSCVPSSLDACFFTGDFTVSSTYQVYTTPFPDGHVEIVSVGPGTVVPGASDSAALFWYFNAANWEVLVKGVDGCALNNEWWIFAAGTTNVHHRVVVADHLRGDQRIYWSFSGPPAPAVTDTSAFSCNPPV